MAGNSNSGGRNRKTTNLHVLVGTYREDRHGDKTNPAPADGVPEPPEKLIGGASAEWQRMVDRMVALRTISKVDDAALYQYVQLFAETEALVDAREHTTGLIDKLEGRFDALEDSDVADAIRNIVNLKKLEAGYNVQIRQGRMALRQYLVEFGMTPAARSRVAVTQAEDTPKSSLARFRVAK